MTCAGVGCKVCRGLQICRDNCEVCRVCSVGASDCPLLHNVQPIARNVLCALGSH